MGQQLNEWSKAMKISKSFVSLVLAATAVTGFTATPALAGGGSSDGYQRGGDYNRDGYYDRRDARDYRRDQRRYERRNYRGYNNQRRYYRSRCSNGTGGAILGAVVGGAVGDRVARRGERTEGAIIGAVVGALGGRALDKGTSRCRRY